VGITRCHPALTFGLEGMQQESPATKSKIQMSTEVTEKRDTVSKLGKKIGAIQKELND
jgi:hypothetical protein